MKDTQDIVDNEEAPTTEAIDKEAKEQAAREEIDELLKDMAEYGEGPEELLKELKEVPTYTKTFKIKKTFANASVQDKLALFTFLLFKADFEVNVTDKGSRTKEFKNVKKFLKEKT